jgi:signal transduction histidine kinase
MEDTQAVILVVDDTELNRVTLSHWLKEQSHQVLLAKSGGQALEVLQDSKVDLILLDILMPEMDGYQVLAKLKADARLRELPVIVISAVDEQDSIVTCIELGAEDYLFKPFNVVILKARIKASLEKRRMRRQEDNYRQQLMASQKMASLGTLAAGVAHELNSPLQVITGVSETLLLNLDRGHALEAKELRERLEAINRNAWRCAEIAGALRTYALASPGQIEAHDLSALVHDALLLMEAHLQDESNIQVMTEISPGLPPLPCDRHAIMQALVNLLTNARDAMPRGGVIRIAADYEPATAEFCLKVSDTGMGISESARSRLFDPFFTTKPMGQGTGLGLSILSGIVTAHRGRVTVDSQPGQGATFALYLPLAGPSAEGSVPLPKAEARFDDTVGPAETQLL